MKNFITVLVIFLIFNNSLHSQSNENCKNHETNIRSTFETPGFLQIRNYSFLGKLKGNAKVDLEMWTIECHDINDTSKNIRGLKIKLTDRKADYQHDLIAYLDADEIIYGIRNLDKILNFAKDWNKTKKSPTELVLLSRDYFKLSCSFEGSKFRGFALIKTDDDFIVFQFNSIQTIVKLKEIYEKAYYELHLKDIEEELIKDENGIITN